MRNTLVDLNNHLFAQMERLGDESLSKEELETEIMRAKAVAGIASQIVSNANTMLDAARFNDSKLDANDKTTSLLIGHGC